MITYYFITLLRLDSALLKITPYWTKQWFPDSSCPRSLPSEGAGETTAAPEWTQKLHHLLGTTQAAQTDKWQIPGNRKGKSLQAYWKELRPWGTQGCIQILCGNAVWKHFSMADRVEGVTPSPELQQGKHQYLDTTTAPTCPRHLLSPLLPMWPAPTCLSTCASVWTWAWPAASCSWPNSTSWTIQPRFHTQLQPLNGSSISNSLDLLCTVLYRS